MNAPATMAWMNGSVTIAKRRQGRGVSPVSSVPRSVIPKPTCPNNGAIHDKALLGQSLIHGENHLARRAGGKRLIGGIDLA